jgi:hypothetical protein
LQTSYRLTIRTVLATLARLLLTRLLRVIALLLLAGLLRAAALLLAALTRARSVLLLLVRILLIWVRHSSCSSRVDALTRPLKVNFQVGIRLHREKANFPFSISISRRNRLQFSPIGLAGVELWPKRAQTRL